MSVSLNVPAVALALLLGLGQAGCNARVPGSDDSAPAPLDTVDAGRPDTSSATAPITQPPAEARRDTPPAGAPAQSGRPGGGDPKVGQLEYEGWRQYSVNCARCHGQDALPNPVAANLLISLASGGPIDTPEKFLQVVSQGRPERGMPAYKGLLSPEQIRATYAYVKGRAEKRIPPGRPARPAG